MVSMNSFSIYSLENMEDIQLMGKRGAFEIIFKEYNRLMKGYYKPCLPLPNYPDGIDESWVSEIVSFHISGILMFNR